MKHANIVKNATAGALLASSLLLAACGSDSDSSAGSNSGGGGTPAATSSTVSGVAATGAPLMGATVVLHCQNSWNEGTTSNDNGQWSMVVPSANLPCAVKATPAGGGQSYYSFTLGNGSSVISNITPLTSLALAKTGTTPTDAWFNALNDAGRQSLSGNLTAAVAALKTALENGGYTLPSGFNPFAVAFTATAGNDYDDLLEELKAALADASTDLNTLLASIASGGSLPDAPDDTETPPASCSSGSDKLVFGNAPADFCGFSKGASANTIANYYQFTSTAGSHGTTYVKFTMVAGGDTVQSVMIENNDYAFSCGIGSGAACSGVSSNAVSGGRQFTLGNTSLGVMFGGTQPLLVNGTLTHLASSSQSGAITLTDSGYNMTSINVAPLVGSYNGTLSYAATPGSALVTGNSCTIDVLGNGTLTVSAGAKSHSAQLNGDVGDLIQQVAPALLVQVLASNAGATLDNSTYAQVSVQRGYVSYGAARLGGYGFSDAADRVECHVINPHPTSMGNATVVTVAAGATAADLNTDYAGTFSNGSCTLNVSLDGTFRVSSGGNTVEARLGGDGDDRVNDFPSLSAVSITVSDRDLSGQTRLMSDVIRYSDGHYKVGSAVLGHTQVVSYPACENLQRQ